MQRRSLLKLAAGSLAAPALIGRAKADAPLSIGLIYVGPVGDFGWSYQHDQARKAVVAHFGDKVKTTYVESVNEGPDSLRVLTELAQKGNQLIFATSFGFMNPTIQAARRFPAVKFEHCTGYKRAANVSTYNIRFYEGRYIEGIIGGMMSKSGVTGYVASVPIPEVIMGMNAYILGARSVAPAHKVKFVMINEWYDPGKEGDATKALVDQGCDVIAAHTDSPSPLQAAESLGVLTFGSATDMIRFAPKEQATASIDNWAGYYIKRVQDVMDGTWTSTDTWGGIRSGMLQMAPFRNITAAATQRAQAAVDGLKNGSLEIFKGPIRDQSGAVHVPAGTVVDDQALSTMNWLAQGIEGKLAS